MKRVVATLALLVLIAAPLGIGSVSAQVQGEDPPASTRAPLRPYDPPLPEPVFIPDLVSDLVLTDLGGSLEVSPLTANPSTPAPGTGSAMDWSEWAMFALPAAFPLLLAVALIVATRTPSRDPESVPIDNAG